MAASCFAALIAFLNFMVTGRRAEMAALQQELVKLRTGPLDNAAVVNAAVRTDPWSIFAGERDRACNVLRALRSAVTVVSNTAAWHSLEEFEEIRQFLANAGPLVLVIRETELRIDGPNRPYNWVRHAKQKTARDVYRALGVRLNKTC